MKRVASILMGILIGMSAMLIGSKVSEAMVVWHETWLPITSGMAKQGERQSREFQLAAATDSVSPASLYFFTPIAVNMNYQIESLSSGEIVISESLLADSAEQLESEEGPLFCYERELEVKVTGKYRLIFSFDADTEYSVRVNQTFNSGRGPLPPILKTGRLTLTRGFTKRLKTYYAQSVTWTSSNPSVASVTKNGTIRGRKTGVAKITALDSNGRTGICYVTVKKNRYSAKKPTVKKVKKGKGVLKVYHIIYRKGALHIKAGYVNRTARTTVRLRKLKITIKNKEGETIGIYKKRVARFQIRSGKRKLFTFKIPKSQLKKKQLQDLRKCSVQISKKTLGETV